MIDPGGPWRNALLIDGATGNKFVPHVDFPLPWSTQLPGLVFLLADNSVRSLSFFLNLLSARTPVALLDPAMNVDTLLRLISAYRPDAVMFPEAERTREVLADRPGQYIGEGAWMADRPGEAVNAALAVLLTTSGSTGNPKAVRLSHDNILSNGRSIIQSLGLTDSDRAITSLPIHYSFGMSIVTSHALAGSPVIVANHSVIENEFWSVAGEHCATFLAGVPQTYEMLHRLRIEDRLPNSVRSMIQAGGRLRPELINHFHSMMERRQGRFHVMYGQTEAAPRMSCLPSENSPAKQGSVGLPMSGGTFEIRDASGLGLAAGEVGEVVYRGPNVMLGYAEKRADLAVGDVSGCELATGDLGYLDDEGFLFLTGRMKRIAKIAGVRISLDDVEALASDLGRVAAVADGDDGIAVFRVAVGGGSTSADARRLAGELRVHPRALRIIDLPDLPTLASGKVDYLQLSTLL